MAKDKKEQGATTFSEMKVEAWPIDRLIPYARNPRKKSAVDKVAASIKAFGFRQAIVVDEQDVIIVGHTRLAAAKKLGLATVPVHVAVGMSETDAKAYRLADNRTNEDAEWDDDFLTLELSDLNDASFDMTLTGFDKAEIAKALGAPGDDDPSSDPQDLPAEYLIVCECASEEEQLALLERLGSEGVKCRAATS